MKTTNISIMIELPFGYYTSENLFKYLKNNLNESQKEFIQNNLICDIKFIFLNESQIQPFAVAHYLNNLCSHIEIIKENMGDIGERKTNFLADMPDETIERAINEYFGKVEKTKPKTFNKRIEPVEESLSAYLRHKNLFFSIINITDGVKAIQYDRASGFQSNNCDVGGDIPKYLLARTINSKQLPFHTCEIDYKIIDQALNDLDPIDYVWIACWHFPKKKLSGYLQRLKQSFIHQKLHSDNKNYLQAWRARKKAISLLIQNIIIIQCREISQRN